MILYLNYSGVLHKTGMVDLTKPTPEASFNLFAWAPILDDILLECDHDKKIAIVLTSSWAHELGWQEAAEYLTVGLKDRVIESTNMELAQFSIINSYRLIEAHAEKQGYQDWLAIDHESDGWNEANRGRLVLTEGATGLSTDKVQAELRTKFKAMLQ
jgi:hypothetical protein